MITVYFYGGAIIISLFGLTSVLFGKLREEKTGRPALWGKLSAKGDPFIKDSFASLGAWLEKVRHEHIPEAIARGTAVTFRFTETGWKKVSGLFVRLSERVRGKRELNQKSVVSFFLRGLGRKDGGEQEKGGGPNGPAL